MFYDLEINYVPNVLNDVSVFIDMMITSTCLKI